MNHFSDAFPDAAKMVERIPVFCIREESEGHDTQWITLAAY
jgi:hypothetical protein